MYSEISGDVNGDTTHLSSIASSLDGNIWKVKVKIGEKISSADQVVMILEAMKTEINIEAGEEAIGLTVVGLARGVREGASVRAGDPLVTRLVAER